MGKLFGTDGVRGMANQYPITPEIAVRIGRAVACLLTGGSRNENHRHQVLIGRDTRISGPMLEYALASGICSMGVDAVTAGVIPTPGISYLTASTDAGAGIVISASHNPYFDNGIKIFNSRGFKLSDKQEGRIEEMVLDDHHAKQAESIRNTGSVRYLEDSIPMYVAFLKRCLPIDFSLHGMKIVLDCANGATFQAGEQIFQELGAKVIALSCEPDGRNINHACGSQHPEKLSEIVLSENADIGLAFDGDGDRLIVVDEQGKIATGDQILAACAVSMKKQGILRNNLLVTTIMSNIGLGVALEENGIRHVTANVGDRYVMEEMIRHDAIIGGEDSGHMIFLDQHTTGDGILAALRLISSMKHENRIASEFLSTMIVFPQKLINVDVKSKPEIHTLPELAAVIRSVETKLGNKGRVLVRYSGTQSMCRVMVEGPTAAITQEYCERIADVVKAVLG
ncbi:MAG: phosphoglucosamine mutase [Desulfobacteraceae bacterium]|nr:MAG: phosphoglucosamine mutase [Desulfobacteraceae bacterium]